MLCPFPKSRQNVLQNWAECFYPKVQSFSFAVKIHDIPFVFKVSQAQLLEDLQNFFPLQWQQQDPAAIEVIWQKPLDTEGWDRIVSPDCSFYGDYISQRDFLAKKAGENQFQLMAFEKIDDGLFNFLRAIVPLQLLERNKVLFHSSSVICPEQKAYVFFGPSGAGKTTISRLCEERGATLLGDDMNILSVEDSKLFVEPAAVGQRYFSKDFFSKKFPIEQMFWLQQGLLHRARPIPSGQISLLLSSFANFFWNQLTPAQFEKLFHLLSEINLKINVLELEFKKDNEVWNHVQSL